MHTKSKSETHILVLSKGEEVVSKIISYCKRRNLKSAWINGIGAISEVELALYDLSSKKYHNKKLSEPLELLSLTGNVAMLKGEQVAHLHIILSNNHMFAFGGHLVSACVSATCEIRLEEIDIPLERRHSDEIGLNLII